MSKELSAILVCPDTGQSLVQEDNALLTADRSRSYPIVDGIPVLLSDSLASNFWVGDAARRKAAGTVPLDEMPALQDVIDDPTPLKFVRDMQQATSGYLYRHLTSAGMTDYPIPAIRLPPGNGKLLLDIGSNWGRWVVSAARAGYRVIGVDIHLEGLRAARRVCAQLGIEALLVCADVRRLPLKRDSIDVAFSYSVLQHFSRTNFDLALAEIGRVMEHDGEAMLQMPNRVGIRNLYNRIRSGFREEDFDVRYYFPSELERYGRRYFRHASTTIDGFFGLGIQPSDMRFFTRTGKLVCAVSEWLRTGGHGLPGLKSIADSLYLHLKLPREPAAVVPDSP